MVEQLETEGTVLDEICGVSTSCVAVADDIAPCATADHPRDVLSQMQHLLNVVEDHGTQLHMKFGKEKCKLLISARPTKIKSVQALLKEEPELLTFYGTPVQLVEDPYVHIGVPQATTKQSQVISEYRIEKGQNMFYKLQGATKNALSGVSPLSNRKMFISYHQPSFLYGTDTMPINATDIECIEVKYRKVLKCMLSLPDCTTSAAVYLSAGVLPASAQRDIDILGLLGQLAICNDEGQNIRKIIENTLTFYDANFNGWSGLVRRTCLKYGLPDPLQYLGYPWRPDRWREFCKRTVSDYWENHLLKIIENMESMKYVDKSYASVRIPMRIWQLAGLCSVSTRQATVQNWMLLGVYFTRVFLHKMKKAKSPLCLCCNKSDEDLKHFLLHCDYFSDIREKYLPQYLAYNRSIIETFHDEEIIIQTILDPLSSNLPENVRQHWSSPNSAYKTSREFCFNMHRKREKFYKKIET